MYHLKSFSFHFDKMIALVNILKKKDDAKKGPKSDLDPPIRNDFRSLLC